VSNEELEQARDIARKINNLYDSNTRLQQKLDVALECLESYQRYEKRLAKLSGGKLFSCYAGEALAKIKEVK